MTTHAKPKSIVHTASSASLASTATTRSKKSTVRNRIDDVLRKMSLKILIPKRSFKQSSFDCAVTNLSKTNPTMDQLLQMPWLIEPVDIHNILGNDCREDVLIQVINNLNEKYAEDDAACPVDLNTSLNYHNTVRKKSYFSEKEKSGRRVVKDDKEDFEELNSVITEAYAFKESFKIGGGNLLSSLKGHHYPNLMSNQSYSTTDLRRCSKASIDSYSSIATTSTEASSVLVTNSASSILLKERERLKSIFNFVRLNQRHTRHLEVAMFLVNCCIRKFSYEKFWKAFFGDLLRHYNMHRVFTDLLERRLIEYQRIPKEQFLEIGDCILRLLESPIWKELVFDAFLSADIDPCENLNSFIKESIRGTSSYCFSQNDLDVCPAYSEFLTQFLCHSVFLQRLLILSFPYFILDLLSTCETALDQEKINLQTALNLAVGQLKLAHMGYHSNSAYTEFFEHANKYHWNIRNRDYNIMKKSTILFTSSNVIVQYHSSKKEWTDIKSMVFLTREQLVIFNSFDMSESIVQTYERIKDWAFEDCTVVFTLAAENEAVLINFEKAPQQFESFLKVWDSVDYHLDAKTKKVRINYNLMNDKSYSLISASRKVALHLWVNLAAIEIDPSNIFKTGIQMCKTKSCKKSHIRIQNGFELLCNKLSSLINDEIVTEFLTKYTQQHSSDVEFHNYSSLPIENVIPGSSLEDLLKFVKAGIPNRVAESRGEGGIKNFFRNAYNDEIKYLEQLYITFRLYKMYTISSVIEDFFYLFQLHVNYTTVLKDMLDDYTYHDKEDIFGELPKFEVLNDVFYKHLCDRHVIPFLQLEFQKLVKSFQSMFQHFRISDVIKSSLIKNSNAIREEMSTCSKVKILELFVTIMEVHSAFLEILLRMHRENDPSYYCPDSSKGFAYFSVQRLPKQLYNRTVRYNNTIIMHEVLLDGSIESFDSITETNSKYSVCTLDVMQHGCILMIGSRSEYLNRIYIHYNDIDSIGVHFQLNEERRKVNLEVANRKIAMEGLRDSSSFLRINHGMARPSQCMIAIKLYNGITVRAWKKFEADEQPLHPFVYFDFWLLLVVKSKSRFGMEELYPSFETSLVDSIEFLSNLVEYMKAFSSIGYPDSDHTDFESMISTKRLNNSLARVRRVYLRHFPNCTILDETKGNSLRYESIIFDF